MVGHLRVGVDHAAVGHARLARDLGRSARVGQPGPDDVLLPGRRARGQARARPGRTARAAPARDPGVRGDGRDHRPRRDLPRDQRGRPGRARLGRGDVDRHGVRARRARAADAAGGDQDARLPALPRGGRRPVRPARDRDRLQHRHLVHGARRRGRVLRRPARAALCVGVAPARGGAGRRRPLGRDVRVGHRPRRRRPRRRSGDERLPAVARGPRARHRARALVPRAADPGAGALGPAGSPVGDLTQRAPAVRAASVDELRDRAAVRARERRRAPERHAARRRGHLADHARDHPRAT